MASSTIIPGDYSFKTSSLEIYYTVTHWPVRPLSREPLIIHPAGWGVYIDLYKVALKPLESDLQLIYLEPRGTSRSSFPDDSGTISPRHHADDLEALRNHLGLNKINVLGHSLGSASALAYAILYPEHVAKVILVAPYLLGHKPSQVRSQVVAASGKVWESNPPKTDEDFRSFLIQTLPYGFLSDTQTYQPVVAELLNSLPPPKLETYLAWRDTNARDEWKQGTDLDKISASATVFIVDGKDDLVCDVEMADTIREGVKGSQLILLERCGHFPWVESSLKFFDAVRGLLRDGKIE